MTTQKLDSVRTILDGTNVPFETFLNKFAKLCGYINSEGEPSPGKLTDQDFQTARFEDIEECGVPRIKARQIARVFRGDEGEAKPTAPAKVVIDLASDPEKHAATLSPVQLIEHYDADNHTNPYGKRLKEVTEGRRCIVFNTDGKLNVEITKGLVDEIVNLSYPERDTVTLDDGPAPVYKVGIRPDRYADENPADPGKPLYQNGESEAGCLWGPLALNVRQLVNLCIRRGDCDLEEGDLFEKVEGKTFANLSKQPRFRAAAVEYQEKKKLGTLPQLKLVLGDSGKPRGENNPFGGGKNVRW